MVENDCQVQVFGTSAKKKIKQVQQFSTNSKQYLFEQRQKYTYHLATIHHNLMVAGLDKGDKVYQPDDDIQNLPPSERVAHRTPGVVTQSMAKKHAKQQKLKQLRQKHPESSDPMIQNQEKQLMKDVYDQLNAEYNPQKFRAKTRDEFLFDIFGHRRDLDIFNSTNFLNYQENDAIASVAKKLIYGESLDINSDDFQYLIDVDPRSAAKIETKKIRVKNKVLQAKDKISGLWLKYVPFVIRGKMMDYAHHNLQLHHV